MCNKAVVTYPSAIQFVPESYKFQVCDKAVDTCRFVFYCVLDQHMSQKICDKVASEELFMLKHCPDK